MGGLDINTPKGQESLHQAIEARWLFNKVYSDQGVKLFFTPTADHAAIDGVAINLFSEEIRALFEIKCRPFTSMDQFWGEYEGKWLITASKLYRAAKVADALCLPLSGLLYEPGSGTMLIKKFYTSKKGWLVPLNVRRSRTKATTNGGSAVRENAYVPMHGAHIFKESDYLTGS